MIHGTYKFSPPQASLLQILHWILMKIWAKCLTRWSDLPAHPMIKNVAQSPQPCLDFLLEYTREYTQKGGGGDQSWWAPFHSMNSYI